MRTKDWRIQQKKADFEELSKRLKVSPYIVRIMRNRELKTYEEMYEFLYGEYEDIPSPFGMKNMREGAWLLSEKIRTGKKIHIIGDYDVDGICSTAILYSGIKQAGGNASYRIPHRKHDGYGMNLRMVDEAVLAGVDTILTCDNGIAANTEIEYAKSQGMTVIVTDHHTVQEKGLPKADIVINPHQEGEGYEYKGICGAVISWKLMMAVYELMGLDEKFIYDMIEFAALATIQDAMELVHENRIIVKTALERIKKGSSYPGINKLIEVCEFNQANLSEYNLAFGINPCLNAGGRLDSAEIPLRLLLATDEKEAEELAEKLKDMNDLRKSMQEKALLKAEVIVESSSIGNDKVLVIELPECHESLAGLVAGKIKEKYYKPTIVLTNAEDGNYKGSGRSIIEYSMFEELQKCSDLLTKFGGHPMAAGLSLLKENVDEFRRRINLSCTLSGEDIKEKVFIDMVMPPAYLDFRWISELKRLSPFGNGNPSPTFGAADMKLVKLQLMGKEKQHVKLMLCDKDGNSFYGLLFGMADELCMDIFRRYGENIRDRLVLGGVFSDSPVEMSVIYEPLENEYRGMKSIELKLVDYNFHK